MRRWAGEGGGGGRRGASCQPCFHRHRAGLGGENGVTRPYAKPGSNCRGCTTLTLRRTICLPAGRGAPIGCCGAAAGTATRGTCGARTATRTTPATATTTSAFALPEFTRDRMVRLLNRPASRPSAAGWQKAIGRRCASSRERMPGERSPAGFF